MREGITYKIVTPLGEFLAYWLDEDEAPVQYIGEIEPIEFVRDFIELKMIAGEGGMMLNFDFLEPNDFLYGFAGYENFVTVLPEFSDLIDLAQPEEKETMTALDAVSDADAFQLLGEGAQILKTLDENSPTFFEDIAKLREILGKLDEKPAESVDSRIGTEWDSVWGRQRLVEIEKSPTGDMYVVKTIGSGAVRKYGTTELGGTEDSLPNIIKKQEYELTQEYRDEVAERKRLAEEREERDRKAQAERDKIHAEIVAFGEWAGMSPMQIGKAEKTLTGMIRNSKDGILSIKNLIEKRVSSGATVIGSNLENPDGSFLEQKQITKTGIKYAEYLLRDQGDNSDGDVSDDDLDHLFGRDKQGATKADAVEAMQKVGHFLSFPQKDALARSMRSEEKQFFFDKMVEIQKTIENMPQSYETDGQGMKAVAYLHYFVGAGDWYITEKDMQGGVKQAFGLADPFGDGGELGYISIEELAQAGAELDLYWTPKTLAEIKGITEEEPEQEEEPKMTDTQINQALIDALVVMGKGYTEKGNSARREIAGGKPTANNPEGMRGIFVAYSGETLTMTIKHGDRVLVEVPYWPESTVAENAARVNETVDNMDIEARSRKEDRDFNSMAEAAADRWAKTFIDRGVPELAEEGRPDFIEGWTFGYNNGGSQPEGKSVYFDDGFFLGRKAGAVARNNAEAETEAAAEPEINNADKQWLENAAAGNADMLDADFSDKLIEMVEKYSEAGNELTELANRAMEVYTDFAMNL